MDSNQILNELNLVFRDILDNNELSLNTATTADDVEEWDSLSHVQIVVAVEKHFKIRFTSKEIQSWNNVGEMVNSINEKIGKNA